MSWMRAIPVTAAFLATVTCCAGAFAQDYPSKPIRFVVPFAPGGSTDIIARSVGGKLTERWGQPVVIDNKPGAATTIGTDFVAKSPADGYTILLTPAPFVIAQYAYPKLGYDSRRDFVPVSLLLKIPLVVATNPQVIDARALPAFVAALKARPGKVDYGSPGNGSLSHLAVELFRLQSGIEGNHVPYKGSAPVIVDLVAGRIGFTFTGPLEVQSHVKAGKLAVLAVALPNRLGYWPEIPTFREAGFPEYEASFWFGVVAPAATPRDLVEKLSNALAAAVKAPDVADKLVALGAEIAGTTPEAYGQFLAAEHARWSQAVKAANVRIE